jgi:membrane protease YdiL (CAAX protease family)
MIDLMDLQFLCFILLVECIKRSTTLPIIKYINIDEGNMILQEKNIKKISPEIFIVSTIITCIIIPPIEEIFYRYLPFTFCSSVLCFIVAVPIFGLSHMMNYFNYVPIFSKNDSLKLAGVQSFNACITGFLYYLLQVRYSSVYPSIIFHIMCNSYSHYGLYKIMQQKEQKQEQQEQQEQ